MAGLLTFAASGAFKLPSGEVPFMGEIAALLGFNRLNPACVIGLQHNAGTIRGVNKGKPPAVSL